MVKITLAVVALVALVYPSSVAALWPLPRSLQTGSQALTLSSSFSIDTAFTAPSDLQDAISRTLEYINQDKHKRLVVGRGSADASKLKDAPSLNKLNLHLGSKDALSIAQEAIKPLESRDESYTLIVPASGNATLCANSTLGLFRGLTTFSQLWYSFEDAVYTIEAPIAITDKPAYPYRGFMLDTARNFFPVTDIKRTLDAMSWVKINTFHWHVVDSQSFPLQVADFPELSEKGAYSPAQVYTPEDVKDIIAYAGERGIDVLIEVDTPGHTAIISESHSDFVACAGAAPWADFANEPPAGQLRLASPSVISFTQSLFSSLADQFPSSYVSTGGDEINLNCYAKDADTQAQLRKNGQNIEQALSTFVLEVHSTLKDKGKTPVVWEEMVIDHPVGVSNDTIVMVWISSANVRAVVDKGYRVVHAPSDYFYLDCGAGEWLGNDIAGNSWCDPFKTWQKAYSFDPLANLTAAQAPLVLGGQHLLWTEQSDSSNLDSIVWPRAAASAEVFWTGASQPNGKPRDVDEALPRLHDIRFRFVQRGVKAIALQPLWCALRPGVCDLQA
ncbi:glycoside hydrolase family 20 protein [Botryobasidium botryosum FD-172 SS1]|uniref:Beta-hexosaminidase n=1 Tax=Botryobasidium botryosum (strain FD-172 SS1) TaxID=930990 RepID=A0A067M948_BOTB1|nr:glycoside hydrolase family 20 protein [Botryobasidium botryosum FD-172 SS1]